MADPARARKLAVRIRQIVSAAIETQIKDPRLGMVTITDVRVTGDLHDATVFYTVLGDEAAHAESAAALESAKGVLFGWSTPFADSGRATRRSYTTTTRLSRWTTSS